ncbi:hypothetical protein PR048_031021 [Dryococelus australis]|uniref:Uncharacterized protein n=1 Tax=Dryococelus australis TaxID=614101 RepID=A0ABQ9G780_9NEOP|nr:hypothetical protein PR048_031021 [Dryococelus australis]
MNPRNFRVITCDTWDSPGLTPGPLVTKFAVKSPTTISLVTLLDPPRVSIDVIHSDWSPSCTVGGVCHKITALTLYFGLMFGNSAVASIPARYLKVVHDKVSTFEINLRKISLHLPAYILTAALSDMRPVRPASALTLDVVVACRGVPLAYINGGVNYIPSCLLLPSRLVLFQRLLQFASLAVIHMAVAAIAIRKQSSVVLSAGVFSNYIYRRWLLISDRDFQPPILAVGGGIKNKLAYLMRFRLYEQVTEIAFSIFVLQCSAIELQADMFRGSRNVNTSEHISILRVSKCGHPTRTLLEDAAVLINGPVFITSGCLLGSGPRVVTGGGGEDILLPYLPFCLSCADPLGSQELAPARVSEDIWAALNSEVMRADVGDGESREKPPTSGVVRQGSHMRKSGSNPAEGGTRFALVGGKRANRSITTVPMVLELRYSLLAIHSHRYTQCDENTTRQFRSLRLVTMVHLIRVAMSSLTFPHFSARTVFTHGATVAERLVCSPPTKANRVQSTAGSPDLQLGIVPDDVVARWLFSGIFRFPRPFIPELLLIHFNHPHRLSRPRC